jgi:hypothetical protein
MMPKRKLTETVVHELADEIDAEGAKVTPDAILERNHKYGSYSSAYKYLRTWTPPEETEDGADAVPPDFQPSLQHFGDRLYRAALTKARVAAAVPLAAALKEGAVFRSDAETAVAAADAAYHERDQALRDAASLAGELAVAKALIASLNAKRAKTRTKKTPAPVE